jgi:peptidoglycan/LPS O-acetylase OafA/YrhL
MLVHYSKALHSLRGVAATAVVIFHSLQHFGDIKHFGIMILPGHAAVSFFFVLSGLVLTQAAEKEPSVVSYLVKRAFRLIPLTAVMALIGGFYVREIDIHMPFKFDNQDAGPLTVLKWISGAVGYSMRPNGPSWSIFVEIIGSLMIPLFLMMRNTPLLIWLSGVALLALALSDLDAKHDWNFFLLNFYAGSLAFWFGANTAHATTSSSPSMFWLVVALISLVFYSTDFVFPATERYFLGDPRSNVLAVACIAPLVALIFYRPEKFSWLEHPWLLFLGEISFSIYLCHWILLELTYNACAWMFPGWQAHYVINSIWYSAMLLAVTIPISWLSFCCIEKPSIELGKIVADHLNAKLAPDAGN